MQDTSSHGIACRDLNITVPGRILIESLGFAAGPAEFIAILGPNGVGKTLALHTLAGLRRAQTGDISLCGLELRELSRQQIALQLALLPQHVEDIFPATVFETVMIGRHPHIGRLRWETTTDREIANLALAQVDLAAFTDRDVLTLSGGERQRLAVAQVLAQAPGIYLLDEPTNHLDPQHQLDVLKIFRREADEGKTVVASLHDVNLAARFADRCLLLFGNGHWEIGDSTAILTRDRLSALYETRIDTVPWQNRNFFIAAG